MRSSKILRQSMILSGLWKQPMTFTELLREMGFSRPALTDYLKELRNDRRVARRVDEKDRVVYELTESGKAFVLFKLRAATVVVQAVQPHVRDREVAQLLGKLTKIALNKPEYIETLMEWWSDLTTYFINYRTLGESCWHRILKAYAEGKEEEAWKMYQETMLRPTPANRFREIHTVIDMKKQLKHTANRMIQLIAERERHG